MTVLLVFATSVLADANGANDNFKGVATLYGSGTTTCALLYATIAALLGWAPRSGARSWFPTRSRARARLHPRWDSEQP
jgi:phosphate/sulfate permease